MRKGLKVLIISLMVAIIMLVALAGTIFAAAVPNTDPGTYPDQDCPNPDFTCDGDGLKY